MFVQIPSTQSRLKRIQPQEGLKRGQARGRAPTGAHGRQFDHLIRHSRLPGVMTVGDKQLRMIEGRHFLPDPFVGQGQ